MKTPFSIKQLLQREAEELVIGVDLLVGLRRRVGRQGRQVVRDDGRGHDVMVVIVVVMIVRVVCHGQTLESQCS